jgi:GT2 family glycosyltransferase
MASEAAVGAGQPAADLGNGSGAALQDVAEVTGSCMLLDMEKLRRIEFFDESFFLYYEDSDLCRRARPAGFRVCIAADAVATYRSGDSSSAMRTGDLLRERLLGQSYAYFTAKHHPRPRRRITRKALAHLSAGIGCLAAGRPARARMRFARMRGILEYLLSGSRALWANRLAGR